MSLTESSVEQELRPGFLVGHAKAMDLMLSKRGQDNNPHEVYYLLGVYSCGEKGAICGPDLCDSSIAYIRRTIPEVHNSAESAIDFVRGVSTAIHDLHLDLGVIDV